jgi:hypothetical protein
MPTNPELLLATEFSLKSFKIYNILNLIIEIIPIFRGVKRKTLFSPFGLNFWQMEIVPPSGRITVNSTVP